MRKRYLDWLRGVAVIAMVMAHVTDAWTLNADKTRQLYVYVVFVAGLAAPLFLARATAARTASCTARTSLPSTRTPGIAYAAARAAMDSPAVVRVDAVDSAYWLFSQR